MKDVNILINGGANIHKSLEIFGDIETYNESLNDFLAEIEEKLANIKNYKEIADMANYAILVHSLKSDAGYFGFEKLQQMAYEHEMASKEGNVVFVNENYDALMTEANRVVLVVKQYIGEVDVVSTESQEISNASEAILVVDDSNVIGHFIQKIFHGQLDVLLAVDGEEAINYINNNQDNKILGMLLDLNMPNVDGFEVLEHLKDNNLLTKIPVAIITGNDSREIDDRAFKYQIVDMLKKPFNEDDVKLIVEKLMLSRQNL